MERVEVPVMAIMLTDMENGCEGRVESRNCVPKDRSRFLFYQPFRWFHFEAPHGFLVVRKAENNLIKSVRLYDDTECRRIGYLFDMHHICTNDI